MEGEKYIFLPRDINMEWQATLLPSYWPEVIQVIFTGFPGQNCVEIVTYQLDPRVGIIIGFNRYLRTIRRYISNRVFHVIL